MKALICIEHPPLIFTESTPWKSKISTLQPKSTKSRHLSSRTWKLRAESKGFGRVPANPKDRRRSEKKTADGDRFGKNDGGDDDDKIADVVFDRIIARILFFVGVPLFTGVVFLFAMDAAKERQLWNPPAWLVFLMVFITFGGSALGLAYGAVSASWDPAKAGSFTGFEEAQKNWVELWREEDEGGRRR